MLRKLTVVLLTLFLGLTIHAQTTVETVETEGVGITHNQAIKPMADRVILIKNGRAESVEVNEHPEPIENIEW